MSAKEVSPFHGIALYTNRHLFTYELYLLYTKSYLNKRTTLNARTAPKQARHFQTLLTNNQHLVVADTIIDVFT